MLLKTFPDETSQDAWVAEQIVRNLGQDELEPDDILVVLPDAYTSKRRSTRFSSALARHGIHSHLAGVGSSVDQLFLRDSIAQAHIYRAKGNEAPMVYVLDSQYAVRSGNPVSRRNVLFTAITRSRAWVRICGHGEDMSEIAAEVQAVKAADFKLSFEIPTAEQRDRLRRIHRDRSNAEVATVERAQKGLKQIVDAFERGDIEMADLQPKLRTRLFRMISEGLIDGTET